MNKMRSPLITFMAPKNKHPQTVNIMYQESATEKGTNKKWNWSL